LSYHLAPKGRIAEIERGLVEFGMFRAFVCQRPVSIVIHLGLSSCDDTLSLYLEYLERTSSDRSGYNLTVVPDY
jgi:hypothetical protein